MMINMMVVERRRPRPRARTRVHARGMDGWMVGWMAGWMADWIGLDWIGLDGWMDGQKARMCARTPCLDERHAWMRGLMPCHCTPNLPAKMIPAKIC